MTNTYSYFLKGCCLVAVLLMTIPLTGQTDKDCRLFKARRQTNLVRSLSTQFTHSDTIPLQNISAIYALSIDATITQPREASFVRIVLEDTDGHDYLVAESDRFRNDTAIVQLTEYCEETARLDGITPVRLKCYLAGDATLQFAGFHISDQEPTRGQTANEETDAAIKEAQVQSIVDRINEYNARHGKLWRAGLNNWALAEYDSDIKGEGDAYTANFKYYTDGIYEMGERPAQRSTYNSPYVDSFDWRNRHGKWWITGIKDQGTTLYCGIFATIGMVEAATNLYFNDTIHIDLSEQSILGYVWPNQANMPNSHLSLIKSYGALDENTIAYSGLTTGLNIENRPEGEECVKIDNYHNFHVPSFSDEWQFDTLKYNIIHYGPGLWGYKYPEGKEEVINNVKFGYHLMTLVGYGTVTPQDVTNFSTFTHLQSNDYNPAIIATDSVIGRTYWIFKDSYGTVTDSIYGHNGFRYVIFYDISKTWNDVYFVRYPIYRRDHNPDDIIIEDRDGDGYFNWGIDERPDSRLPEWAAQLEDADDSNDTIGSFSDIYGHTITINYGWSSNDDNYVRTNGQIDDSSIFIRGVYEVVSNATVAVTGSLIFHPQSILYLCDNSTLSIDGGAIVDPSFVFGNNTKVILKNGGKIYFTKRMPSFALPIGLSLEIQQGEVKYIRDYSTLMP